MAIAPIARKKKGKKGVQVHYKVKLGLGLRPGETEAVHRVARESDPVWAQAGVRSSRPQTQLKLRFSLVWTQL